VGEYLDKLRKHWEQAQAFQQAHINTKPRIWAAIIAAVLILNLAIAAVIFFLFGSLLEEGELSLSGAEVTIEGVSISTPAILAEDRETLISGDREIIEVSQSLSARTSRVVVTCLQSYPFVDDMQTLANLEVDAYIQYLASYENFWLLAKSERDERATADLLKVTGCQRVLSVRVEASADAPSTYALPRVNVHITTTYTLRDLGIFGMPFERVADFDHFLSSYGVNAGELLLSHDGLNFDSMAAYLQTVGDTLEGMSSEETAEFGRALRSFLWGLFLASLSVIGPLSIIAVVRFAYNAKRKVDQIEEIIPDMCERYPRLAARLERLTGSGQQSSDDLDSSDEISQEDEE